MSIEQIMDGHRQRVDCFINDKLEEIADDSVTALQEAMSYALAGGKRIRAILVMMGAELAGAQPELVLPTAGAVECFHAYSLIHDDLPAMDDSDLRRGRPSVHIQYGEAVAILAGDSLIPLGFQWISEDQRKLVSAGQILEVLALFAKALGTEALTGGQYLDLQAATVETPNEEIFKRKTAALIQTSLLAGAMLGGVPEANLDSLRAFGLNLGLAYQLVDDLLDRHQDDKAAATSVLDVERRIEAASLAAIKALDRYGEQAANLRELGQYLGRRSH